jgi:hypothetical protein
MQRLSLPYALWPFCLTSLLWQQNMSRAGTTTTAITLTMAHPTTAAAMDISPLEVTLLLQGEVKVVIGILESWGLSPLSTNISPDISPLEHLVKLVAISPWSAQTM